MSGRASEAVFLVLEYSTVGWAGRVGVCFLLDGGIGCVWCGLVWFGIVLIDCTEMLAELENVKLVTPVISIGV